MSAQARSKQTSLTIRSDGPGLTEFTPIVSLFVRESGIKTGLLTLFVRIPHARS